MRDWKERYQQSLDTDKLDVNIIEGYVGAGYGIASPEVFQVIKQLAALEGIVLDPVYTGKAFYGLIDRIKSGLFDDSPDIVFLHTGGIFGLFPQRDQIFEIEPLP